MTDDYGWWREALAKGIEAVTITANDPQCGFFKMRRHRGGEFLPVAIWRKDGTPVCRVANEMREPLDVWTFCAGNPVSKEDAKVAFETGRWPGDAPSIGDNSGDLSLTEQIKEYAAMAVGWLRGNGIKDKTSADMAANYRAKLLQLKKEADEARVSEKAPHLSAAKAVDDKWRAPIAQAADAAEDIRAALTSFMVAEEKRLREEAEAKRKEEEARIAAERERIEKERAEKMARDPIAAMTDPEPELPIAPAAPEPVKIQAGGQRGRKTGLRTITKYVVTDYDAALAHCKDHPTVHAAVEKVAADMAKAGAAVPGVEARVEKVAA